MDILLFVAEKFGRDLSLGRMLESFLLLAVIWRQLRPHLTKLEDRLQGVEDAVKLGFADGQKKFMNFENRISALELGIRKIQEEK